MLRLTKSTLRIKGLGRGNVLAPLLETSVLKVYNPCKSMVLQLTSLIPSLAGTLRYSAGVTAFTFSLSSGVKPQFTQAPRDLTHQRSLGHLSTKSVTPNSDPCPQQLLPLHSAQLKAPGCNHPLILEKNSSSLSLTALWQLLSHHS